MRPIMADLWNGNLSPITSCGKTAEIENLIGLLAKNTDRLGKTLNEEQKKLFDRYMQCIEEYMGLLTEEAFCDGFSLGVRLMTEAVTDNR